MSPCLPNAPENLLPSSPPTYNHPKRNDRRLILSNRQYNLPIPLSLSTILPLSTVSKLASLRIQGSRQLPSSTSLGAVLSSVKLSHQRTRTPAQNTHWQPLNTHDLRRFLSVRILSGIVRLPSLRLYWSFRRGTILNRFGLSFQQFTQIKRYIYVPIPTPPPLPRKEWWLKLEPLSSH